MNGYEAISKNLFCKQTADLCTKISLPYRFDESYLSALGKRTPTENLKKIWGAAFELFTFDFWEKMGWFGRQTSGQPIFSQKSNVNYRIGANTTPVLIITPLLANLNTKSLFCPKSPLFEQKFDYNASFWVKKLNTTSSQTPLSY